jgi:hypothetical protein
MVNMGLSQQLFKGKGTLRLTGRDVFRTQKIKGEIKYSNIDAASINVVTPASCSWIYISFCKRKNE